MTSISNIDITSQQWEIIRNILQTHIPNKTVWAFGSRVNHQAKLYSDLDLVIIDEAPLSLTLFATLRDAFTESALPFKVDLVDWAATSNHFKKIIEKQYVVVQTRLVI